MLRKKPDPIDLEEFNYRLNVMKERTKLHLIELEERLRKR